MGVIDFREEEALNINVLEELLSNRKHERLLKYVYEHDMYDINVNMIGKLLEYFYNIECGNDFLNKNLSLILSNKQQPLCRYVMENINSYLELLFSNVDELSDTINVVLYVLNTKEVIEQNKQAYIDRTSTAVDYLFNVENRQLWSYILQQDKADKNIENIYDYYYLSENGMDEELVDYINRFENCPEFNKIDLDGSYGKESKLNLFYDIVKSNSLDNDKYESILCTFGDSCRELKEMDLSTDKVNILINQDILEMNVNNLDIVRKNYPNNLEHFIVRNINEYVEIMDKTIFVSSELLYLLSMEIEEELKLKLLQIETEPISIEGKNYSSNVEDYIVENLYCEEDFEYFVQWYPENRETIRTIIFNIAIKEVEQIKEIQCKVHPELFMDLVKSKQIDIADKRYIIAKQVELGVDMKLVRIVFDYLQMTEYLQLLDGKRPKIRATLSNEKLLDALLMRNWISSYEEDKEDTDYFQTYGKRKRIIEE